MVEARTAELGHTLAIVEKQAQQLRTLDEAKSRFFANVSHEFRTPLSLIVGPVEDLRDGRAGALPDAVRKRLDSVLSNGRRLTTLVEQLLDVARLESGTMAMHAEVRDIVPLLRRVAESFASMAERKGIAFRVSCPVGGIRVRHDPDHLEKVVGNLLGNALKFTPAGGQVELRAHVDAAEANGWAVLEVEDTGPGIPEAHQPHVFERFYQVDDSARRAHEGTGIGLALARELVELHDGTVSLRSVVGAGSTFIVRLPLVRGDAPAVADAPSEVTPDESARATTVSSTAAAPDEFGASAAAAGDDRTTVLVVEDDAELLAYLKEHLSDEYRVIEADNGRRALELARELVPDLIVSDVMMPELDGQDCALPSAIRNRLHPVILPTAKAPREPVGWPGTRRRRLPRQAGGHEGTPRARREPHRITPPAPRALARRSSRPADARGDVQSTSPRHRLRRVPEKAVRGHG
jgi:nitrogen-specific signal transduction histidine kinase